MWWNLDNVAKVVGGVWFVIGIICLAIATRGVRSPPRMIGLGEQE
jgi:hypothetical protein